MGWGQLVTSQVRKGIGSIKFTKVLNKGNVMSPWHSSDLPKSLESAEEQLELHLCDLCGQVCGEEDVVGWRVVH